jgi:hypothetical protein
MCRRWFSRDDEKAAMAEAAAQQRAAAEEAKQVAIRERAEAKREDITDALSASQQRKGRRGGGKSRNLMMAQASGEGFLGRFG